MVYSGVHVWNHVWTKYLKITWKNKWRRQWSNLTWQINKLQCFNITAWIVEMNGGWCGLRPSKGNIIILKIKKVAAIRCNILYFVPLRFSWSVLLQYSISKHGGWLIAFFGWNWGKTKYTIFIFKHLWHFTMDVLVNIVFCKFR